MPFITFFSLLISAAIFFGHLADNSSQDNIAKVYADALNQNGQTLLLIKHLIFTELSKISQSTVGSAFRANNLTTKLETAFARTVSQNFLKKYLGKILYDIIADPTLDLEIDSKFYSYLDFYLHINSFIIVNIVNIVNI